jgi:protein involved in polysaccharide export with SLBB domain
VLGEVRTPGVYYVTGVEKLLDVIALAGGETADSDMSEIFVERQEEEFVFDAEELLEDEGENKDFYLKSGDRVFVSRKWGTARNTALLFTGAGLLVAIIALVTR